MQTIVNIHEARTNFSRLLEDVECGEEVIITRAGQPVAILAAYRQPCCKIAPPGGMEGEIWMADDFNQPVDHLFKCLTDDESNPGTGE